jgi:hypothetical protein
MLGFLRDFPLVGPGPALGRNDAVTTLKRGINGNLDSEPNTATLMPVIAY